MPRACNPAVIKIESVIHTICKYGELQPWQLFCFKALCLKTFDSAAIGMAKRDKAEKAAPAPRTRITKKTKAEDCDGKKKKKKDGSQKPRAIREVEEDLEHGAPATPANKMRRTSSPTKSNMSHVAALMEVKKVAAGQGLSVEEYLQKECGESLSKRLQPSKSKQIDTEDSEARPDSYFQS